MLISWKRLLAGQPPRSAGRPRRAGRRAVTGLALSAVFRVFWLVPSWLGAAVAGRQPSSSTGLRSRRSATPPASASVVNAFSAVLYALVFLFMLVLLRVVVRKQWLAAILWCLILAPPLRPADPVIEWIDGGVRAIVLLAVLTRCGLLAFATALFFMFMTFEAIFTLDLSVWYAPRGLPVLLSVRRARGLWLSHLACGEVAVREGTARGLSGLPFPCRA